MLINETMRFTTYNDFYNRRYIIKSVYNRIDKEHQDIYKMYLYANRWLSVMKCDLMWEFLNEPENSEFRPSDEDLRKYCTGLGEDNIEH